MQRLAGASLCTAFAMSAALLGGGSAKAPAKGRAILVDASANAVAIRRVSYADLDVAAAAGQRTLLKRVRYAVRDLCSEVAGGFDGPFMFSTDEAHCVEASWGEARAQVERAVYRAREIALGGRSSLPLATMTITVAAQK